MRKNAKITCTSFLGLMLALLTTCAPGANADIAIVRDGVGQARIIIGEGASAQVAAAAQTLADYIAEATGAQLEIVREHEAAADFAGISIRVGPTASELGQGLIPEGLDEDGFVIVAQDSDIVICGPTDWGTEFGVYEFLERFVGVRWLLPGEDGTDVPAADTITVPEGRMTGEPVFFSRLLSGLRGEAQGQWARFNRMRGRVSFHHNLIRLFPPEKYTQTHPEFFPIRQEGGERYLPQSEADHGWQPCLTAPGIVEEAAKNIIEFFNENPTVPSYSLGMNDSGHFCRCEDCLARISGEKNYLGWVDYSELYYDWANQIIEKVLEVHPDKWFGCLAYFNVSTPPKTIEVHPRMVPYITYDRMKWIDPELREAGHVATREWQESVPTFAWYDYIYGTPYCLPRMYIRHAADYLRFGADNGVKAHYAEIYPNFGEGPKPYMHLKLWWNPHQDEEALLNEWYERCVGPEAAPFMAEYYDIWERFWTEDILESQWFPKTGTWLPFSSATYLADVKMADITRSRELLEAAIAHAQTDKQRARAQLMEKAFQYYEASAIAYLASMGAGDLAAATEEEALALLDQGLASVEMAQKRRYLVNEVFADDPVLVHPLGVDRYAGVAGANWGGNIIWGLANWVRQGDNAVRRRIEELAREADAEVVREQADLLLRVVDGNTTLVGRNPSFEEGDGDAAAHWSFWRKPDVPPDPPIGRIVRSRDVALSGEYSLLCDGLLRGGPVQTLDFPGAGKYAAIAWVYVPEGQEIKGHLELSVTPLDEGGRNLPGYATRVDPTPGSWSLVILGVDLPETIGNRTVRQVRIIPIVDGYEDGGLVYWDDVGLHRVD